jgi:opacity protein-like surface antigen
MQIAKSGVLTSLVVVMLATPALGQQVSRIPPPPPGPRGYIAALAGAISGPPREGVFSVEGAERVARDIQVYASVSWIDNMMSESTRADIETFGVVLSQLIDTPLRFTGRDRGLAFVVGGKYLPPTGIVRPYVAAGGGVLNIKRTIVDPLAGDVSAALFNDFGFGNVELIDRSATKPMLEAGVGVAIAIGHVYVDAGYRYRRAFRLGEPLELKQFTAGIGYAF